MTEERLTVNLSGKTAIVTGSSRGIGKAISFALSQAGANVVIAARSEEESPAFPGTIYKTVEEIKGLGWKALAVRCDVTEDGEVKSMVEQAVETYGAIDILVNNAGVMLGSSFLETGGADFSNSWRVNVLGPFLCTKAVLPHMIPRKSGSIVNISSGMAESNQPHSIIYSMSKVALNKMMLKLAAETTEYNIAVNLLYPPMVRLERMIAMMPAAMVDRLPPASVVGPPAAWLAAQDASSFTGKIVPVNTFGIEWP